MSNESNTLVVKKSATDIAQKIPDPITTAQHQMMSREMTEIQSAMSIAKHYPRDLMNCMSQVKTLFAMDEFAQSAIYKKPQGSAIDPNTGKKIEKMDKNGKPMKNYSGYPVYEVHYVTGLSIDAALQLKSIATNIHSASNVVDETPTTRTIEVSAWDLETNNRRSEQIIIEKVIERSYLKDNQEAVGQRTNSSGKIVYKVVPTEDEVRLLTSRLVAFAERNCLLKTINPILVEQAEKVAQERLLQLAGGGETKTNDTDDAENRRIKSIQTVIGAFKKIGIQSHLLEAYTQTKYKDWTPDIIADLVAIGKQLKDSPDDVVGFVAQFNTDSEVEPTPVANARVTPSSAPNRGHGKDKLAETQDEPKTDSKTKQFSFDADDNNETEALNAIAD